MKMRLSAALAGIAVAACSFAAQAALVTTDADFRNARVMDFSHGNNVYQGTGPVDIGTPIGEGLTWTAKHSVSQVYVQNYGFGANGTWNQARGGFTGVNSGSGHVQFTFADGVNSIGGFINYTPNIAFFDPVEIIAYDSAMNELERYNLFTDAPISTPGQQNAGAFRGIAREDNDIFAFRLTGSYAALDDLTFSHIVPEPGSLALIGAGLLGMAGMRRKRRA